jgi:hypothetical protein
MSSARLGACDTKYQRTQYAFYNFLNRNRVGRTHPRDAMMEQHVSCIALTMSACPARPGANVQIAPVASSSIHETSSLIIPVVHLRHSRQGDAT